MGVGALCALVIVGRHVLVVDTPGTSIADSYVTADGARQNFGRSTTIKVGGSPLTYGYLRFEVDVPVGERVTNAVLRLYTTSSSSSGITAHAVADNGWGETTIEYADAPPMGAPVASSATYSAGGYVSLDVTALVRDGLVSIGLGQRSGTSSSFYSREAASNKPELVVQTAPTDDTTPPETSIAAKPASPTSDDTPSFAFTSTEAGTFECRVDAEAFAACVSPHTPAALADGSHSFEVRARDSAGTVDPSAAVHRFTVDTVPPAPPTGLAATIRDGAVRLAWDEGSEPDLGHYEVLRSTAAGGPYSPVAKGPESSHMETSVTDGGSYHYVVEAIDRAGNRSRFSNEASVPPPRAAPSPGASVGAPAVPSRGAYLGTYVRESMGRTLVETEAMTGGKFAIARDYRRWDDSPFIETEHGSWADGGRLVYLSWNAMERGGSVTSWADIASGGHDARIDAVAREAKLFGRPMFIAFHHEPEDEVGGYGGAVDFADAFRRIVRRFEQHGVSNVAWVWNIMGASKYYGQYTGGLYPGDDVVDWIAWDPYNWVDCHGRSGAWVEFADKVQTFYDWLGANGHADKPFMLGEYGSDEPLAGQPSKGSWFRGARDAMSGAGNGGVPRFPNLKALVYFDSDHTSSSYSSGCAWHIDSSASSLSGFQAMGADPYFQPAGGG